ncbi:hypothetical protein ACFLS1_00475 [Verrucomicrobiota bacterium]
MNLKVDLILETEQRSGSVINLKIIIRVISFLIPAVLGVIVLFAVINSMQKKNELNTLENKMSIAEPKQKIATKLRNQLTTNLDIMKELEGWRSSHIDWHQQLINIQREVPLKIQFESFDIKQVLQLADNRTPSRCFTLTIKGLAKGNDAENNIQHLSDNMANSAAFTPLTEDVNVWGSRDNRKGADKTDRIFRIDCIYKPRKFE